MRILFIGHNATYTGAPKSLLRIMRYLKEQQLAEFELLLRNDGPLRAEYEAVTTVHQFMPRWAMPTGGHWVLNKLRAFGLRAHRAFLLARLKNKSFQLIYANTVVNANVLEFLASLRLPAVAHLREMHVAIDAYGGRPMIDRLERHVQHYISVSHIAKSALMDYGVASDKISVVYNFIEPKEFAVSGGLRGDAVRKSLGLVQGDILIGNVGTFNHRKGSDLFLGVADQVLAKHANVHFLWVGDLGGVLPESILKSLDEKVRARLHLLGEIPHPYGYYEAMDVFLLTSRDDPFPLSAIEAAYYNKPIVCIKGTGGIAEVLGDHRLVSETIDVSALVHICRLLIEDDALRLILGNEMRKRFIDDLKIDQQVNKILLLIKSYFGKI